MTSNKTSSRQSMFSTPQAKRKSSCARRSLSQLDLKEPNETLFSTLMNDPLKKALLLQLLAKHKNGDKDLTELMQRKNKEDKSTKLMNGFSPISVHRKKILAAHEAANNTSPPKKPYTKAAIPFNKLLAGVVAYVEIISKGQDRSAGVKALLKTMGGRVSEYICKGITHAIIKDVSYETYKKANMAKAHLVSVLWLEAVRKNHCRVPEKHYPALGPQAYTSNVSLLCEELQQEYAEVVQDELECSRNLQKKIQHNLSSHFVEDIVNSSISGDSSSTNSQIGTDIHHSNEENKENSEHNSSFDNSSSDVLSDKDDNDYEPSVKTPLKTQRAKTTSPQTQSDSINLRISSECNKKDIVASESIGSLRISAGSSKRRTTGSSVLSSLRISTESNKSKKQPPISSDVIESLRLSSNSPNRRLTRRSSALSALEISSEHELAKNGISEAVGSLRISTASSRGKTAESSVALSSLRISLSPDSSKDFNSVSSDTKSSRRSSDRLKKKLNLSNVNNSNYENDSNQEENLSPDIPVQKDIYANVTERKKRRQTRLNFSSFDENNCAGEQLLEDSNKAKVGRKLTTPTPKSNSSKRTKITENKPKSIERKRRQTRLNFSSSDESDCINNSIVNDSKNKNSKENIEIAPILMTPSAKKLLDNLQYDHDFLKKPENVEKKNNEISSVLVTSSAKKLLKHLHSNSSENDSDKSQKDENKPKVVRKRKLYNENDNNILSQWLESIEKDEEKKKDYISKKIDNDAAVLISPDRNKDPSNVNNTQKSKMKTVDDNLFKTPGKPVRAKNIESERRLTQKNRASQEVRTSQRNRRSTLDFLPKESYRSPRKTPMKPKKLTGIVCSRFHSKEVVEFERIVKKLGNFVIERDVTEKSSHLVLAEPKRTVNVLRAMARGCWILKSEWLYKSLKEGKWLPEENYEMTEFSQAVQKSRQERQAFGGHYTMDVFSDCGKIYISKTSSPQCSDLQDLVKICKGNITTIRRNADLIIGEYVVGNVKCLRENWILDCIQFYKVQSFKSYLLIPDS